MARNSNQLRTAVAWLRGTSKVLSVLRPFVNPPRFLRRPFRNVVWTDGGVRTGMVSSAKRSGTGPSGRRATRDGGKAVASTSTDERFPGRVRGAFLGTTRRCHQPTVTAGTPLRHRGWIDPCWWPVQERRQHGGGLQAPCHLESQQPRNNAADQVVWREASTSWARASVGRVTSQVLDPAGPCRCTEGPGVVHGLSPISRQTTATSHGRPTTMPIETVQASILLYGCRLLRSYSRYSWSSKREKMGHHLHLLDRSRYPPGTPGVVGHRRVPHGVPSLYPS